MKSNRHESYTQKLSAHAYDDLVNIQNYTYSKFGKTQWGAYAALFDEAFLILQKQPYVRGIREDIPSGYRSWIVGKHIIVYRIEDSTVYVIRVLHSRMDFRYRF